jgi:hypothetical protein
VQGTDYINAFALRLCIPATMSSQTYDPHTPSDSSSRTSISGVLYHKSSKETIQSPHGSISNSSDHTSASKDTIPKDVFGLSEQGPFPVVSRHSRTHPLAQIPLLLITNPSTLSQNRLLISEINLCLVYAPSASPTPVVLPLVPHQGSRFVL